MSWFPDRKVLAGGFGGIVAWLLTLVLARYGIPLTPEMQTMITTGVGMLLAYAVPPAQRDIIRHLNDELVAIAAAKADIPVTPAKAAASINVVAKRIAPALVMFCALGLVLVSLSACQSASESAKPQLAAVVQNVEHMTPQQKYEVACNAAEGLHFAYLSFVAPKQKPATNAQELAAYEAVQAVCATKPENYATGMVAMLAAVNAYKQCAATYKALAAASPGSGA
ncbi:hypothetical protein GCM10007036_14630 [Alsobacter metallidurans]|uniref:Uncharacterized protein n=1 Tax=Alsobacter metallidurans TaxID=340221 RepID=A0A917I4Y4_9HYPH|nr:hypothetical protein [Alsobacter metallidurans]GGH14968.1 hypothetical protein GCM10007036_14630 [Alsobacter metallidurans]